LAECKNIRESSKEGGEAYRVGGTVVGYKVETQKTRAAKGDPTSRYYDVRQFEILGVCVGMQLLASIGREFGDHAGLDWIAGEVDRLVPSDPSLKIPHMGWNEVVQERPHALWEGIADRSRFYFVHSYYPQPAERALTAASCDYGTRFTCAVARDNIFAVQFHPEKSGAPGSSVLQNFLRIAA
jgi:glutamine amidotransferase